MQTAMTLADYLKRHDLSLTAFGAMLKTPAGAGSVSRWRDGLFMPRPERVKQIEAATEGKVTHRDLWRTYDKRGRNGA